MEKDDRITVIHKQNGGLSSARNAALAIRKGEYIYFLDSDDYIDEKAIETVVLDAEETGTQIVEAPFIRVYDDKTISIGRTKERKIMNIAQAIRFNLGAYGGGLSPRVRNYTKKMSSVLIDLLKVG